VRNVCKGEDLEPRRLRVKTTTYKEIQGLSRMTVGELREKYLEVFGEETRSHHKEFLLLPGIAAWSQRLLRLTE
jgi:hypothetical protein